MGQKKGQLHVKLLLIITKKWTNKYGSHKPKIRIKKQKKIT